MQKIYIVGVDKLFSEYADKLTKLIKERGIEAMLYTYEEYQKTDQLSDIIFGDAKLIFVGTNSSGQSVIPSITSWKYERFACRIGWKENQCLVFARDSDLPFADYKDFRDYCQNMQLDYSDVIIPPENLMAEGLEAFKKFINNKNNHSAHRAQYSTLIHEFMDSYFDEFINYDNGCESSTGDAKVPPDINGIKDILRKLKESALASLTWKQALLCHTIIHPTALGCSAVAFLPIPVADTLPITSAQVAMVLWLSKVFDIKLTKSDAQILLKMAATPLAGRALSKAALVFVPGVGWAINGAIAGIITEILGWTIVIDFATKSKS